VVAKNRSFSSSTFSDEAGEFSMTLEPGDYAVKVVASGFSEVQQAVSFKQAEFRPLEIILQIGGLRDTITVTVAETAGYQPLTVNSATKTPTMLRDVPQSITVVTQALVKDQRCSVR
jgi:outer membrane receptor for ferric coprogen and ferric-rhodotorulic acid